MSKTGSVFADALIKSGVNVSGYSYSEWGSSEDYKFPFASPGKTGAYMIDSGWTKIFNVIRRTAEKVDVDWIKSCEAVNTDNTLLTWMKSNPSLLKIINSQAAQDAYNESKPRMGGEAQSLSLVPSDYRPGLMMYIEYDVINAEFVLKFNFNRRSRYSDITSLVHTLDILNYITDNAGTIEFIPIRINYDFKVSHRAYRDGGEEIPEVSVPYMGRDIVKNTYAMSRLSNWVDEGNIINPRSEYFILANRDNRSKLYLRKKKNRETSEDPVSKRAEAN